MVYANPGGFNFGPENWDGYGISLIVFTLLYSTVLYSACAFLFLYRNHPLLKMRNVPLMISAVAILHVFTAMCFVVYTLNGAWPCQVEFWCMNLYLPIGIGLYQASNQQLLMVSHGQAQLAAEKKYHRALPAARGQGIGRLRYGLYRLKFWWNGVTKQSKYLGFVYAGIAVQVCMLAIILRRVHCTC